VFDPSHSVGQQCRHSGPHIVMCAGSRLPFDNRQSASERHRVPWRQVTLLWVCRTGQHVWCASEPRRTLPATSSMKRGCATRWSKCEEKRDEAINLLGLSHRRSPAPLRRAGDGRQNVEEPDHRLLDCTGRNPASFSTWPLQDHLGGSCSSASIQTSDLCLRDEVEES
jgi:hypothetical protein